MPYSPQFSDIRVGRHGESDGGLRLWPTHASPNRMEIVLAIERQGFYENTLYTSERHYIIWKVRVAHQHVKSNFVAILARTREPKLLWCHRRTDAKPLDVGEARIHETR